MNQKNNFNNTFSNHINCSINCNNSNVNRNYINRKNSDPSFKYPNPIVN